MLDVNAFQSSLCQVWKTFIPAFHLMLEGRREAQQEEKYLPTQLSLEHEKVSTTQTSNQEKRGQCIAQRAIMSKDLDLITSVSASAALSGATNLFTNLSMGAISLSSSTGLSQPCKLSRK